MDTEKELQKKASKLSPIPFRVTDEEKAEIAKAAIRVGLTTSAYIRACVLEAPTMRATRKASIEKELLAKLLGQIGKIGGNLNQLSQVNFSENTTEKELLQTLGEIREAASSIMQALGKKPHDY